MRYLVLPVVLTAALGLATPALADITATFHCADGASFDAIFTPPTAPKGQVTLRYPTGKSLVLPQALSADGGRYADSTTEFWVKGNGARLTVNGSETQCEAKP